MNSPKINQVIEKILQQAACPRCGTHLRDCDYDVQSVDSERLIIELDCDRCESVLTLEGLFKREVKQQNLQNVVVSPETVHAVGQALRSFRGQDIKELLGQ